MDDMLVQIIGTSLGTGGTASVNGNEDGGVLTVTTGTSPSGGDSVQLLSARQPYLGYELIPLDSTTRNSGFRFVGQGLGVGPPQNWTPSTTYTWAYRST